ncbi:MAG: hypothetical protein K2X99_01570 [Gemmatimonadaceae bacterium]|nr:hypothetical protein [Gemmatimonadaceae bacterium]
MRHFHRSHLMPDRVLEIADAFFPTIGMKKSAGAARTRTYSGTVGTPEVPMTLQLSVKMEGGHYTFIEAHTDQMGESRLDRNVKKFFVRVHQQEDATHAMGAAY